MVDSNVIESDLKRQRAKEDTSTGMTVPDTALVTRVHGQKGCGPLSRKGLVLRRLGRPIQMSGNKGHDSLEDAMASRDLVHWHVPRGVSRAMGSSVSTD